MDLLLDADCPTPDPVSINLPKEVKFSRESTPVRRECGPLQKSIRSTSMRPWHIDSKFQKK